MDLLSMAPREFVRLVFVCFWLLSDLAIAIETTSQNISIPFATHLSVESQSQPIPFSQRPGHEKSGTFKKIHSELALDELFSNITMPGIELDAVNPADIVTHYAILSADDGDYTDATATLLVYGVPETKHNQVSAASLWFVSDGDGGQDSIETGWHVAPNLYNDNNPRFFVRFTSTKGKGCYNLYCEGFVRESPHIPGGPAKPVSIYNGPQYELSVRISRNVHNGNWEVYTGSLDNAEQLQGYWPVTLFGSLLNNADRVLAGGYVQYLKGDTNPPPMGSGHFASEGSGKAAGVILKHWDNGVPYTLPGKIHTDREDCYTIDDSKEGNTYSYFGGPAGCKD